LKERDREMYDNIWEYMNGSIAETMRKITNAKRWREVIWEDGWYLKSLEIDPSEMNGVISSELVNKFTKINNLFIKKDSTNALSMYDNTMWEDGEIVSDRRYTETDRFDKLELWYSQRNGYNIIQWASNKMLTQAIQKRILEFNRNIWLE